jgi:hypothetical protein
MQPLHRDITEEVVERSFHGGDEVIANRGFQKVQGEVRVEVLEFDQEEFTFGRATGVDALDTVIDSVPVHEALRELQDSGVGPGPHRSGR